MIKATDRKLVVGLEIGTAKVAALVGEVLPDGMINIIGVGSCPSRGMDKGGVNDLESVVKCVQRAIDQAELMADCQISSVYLALSGKHISCQNEIGMVPISEEEVTQDDVENVVHTAKSVRVRDEHRVLHVIPQEYAIDYQEGIKNPVGLSGVRMQAKVHLITCHNDMAKNIVKAVERCGLKVDQLIFAGLAASYSVLTEDERELGVCVVDIGGGTMDIAVYTGGALRHTKVIPYAGNVVTMQCMRPTAKSSAAWGWISAPYRPTPVLSAAAPLTNSRCWRRAVKTMWSSPTPLTMQRTLNWQKLSRRKNRALLLPRK